MPLAGISPGIAPSMLSDSSAEHGGSFSGLSSQACPSEGQKPLEVSSLPLPVPEDSCRGGLGQAVGWENSPRRIGIKIHLSDSHSVMSDFLQLHRLYSLSSSSVHRILQARILEWAARVAISFSRGSS